VYGTVDWLSASQGLCFVELVKTYRQCIESCPSIFVFLLLLSCANPTGCNILLFRRKKWLIFLLFSSLFCKLLCFPQYIYSAWMLCVCFGKATGTKNLPQGWSLFGRSNRSRHYPIIVTNVDTLLFPPGFCWYVTCDITLSNKTIGLFSRVI
jgi:hypothetical protein